MIFSRAELGNELRKYKRAGYGPYFYLFYRTGTAQGSFFGLGSGLEIFGPYGPLLTTMLFLNYMKKIVIFILFLSMKQNCCSIKYQVFSCISHLDFEPEPKKKINFSDETKSRTETFLFFTLLELKRN